VDAPFRADDPAAAERGHSMMTKRVRVTDGGSDLLHRLQTMLYDYHDLGRFEEAKPLLLWLMEIAEAESRKAGSVLTHSA
jgi:hypothetical protein